MHAADMPSVLRARTVVNSKHERAFITPGRDPSLAFLLTSADTYLHRSRVFVYVLM